MCPPLIQYLYRPILPYVSGKKDQDGNSDNDDDDIMVDENMDMAQMDLEDQGEVTSPFLFFSADLVHPCGGRRIVSFGVMILGEFD